MNPFARGVGRLGTLTLTGRLTTKAGISHGYKRVTANYTLLPTDASRLFVGAANLTITLPAAATLPGALFTVMNDNFTGTTVATAGGTINGAATDATSLAGAYGKASYFSDGANWRIS